MLKYLGTIIVVIVCVFITIKVYQLNTHIKAIDSIMKNKDILRLKISQQGESKLNTFFSKNDKTNSSNTSSSHLSIIMINYLIMQNKARLLSYSDNHFELGIVSKEDIFSILFQSDNQHHVYTVKYIETSTLYDSILTEKLADWSFKEEVDN
jgi:hypothetical protein